MLDTMTSKADLWVQYDPYSDVASSLNLLAFTMTEVSNRPGNWKWIVLSCHSALQGALVCSLLRPHRIDVLDEKSGKAWLKYEEGATKVPKKLRLASFEDLMMRAQNAKRPTDARLTLTDVDRNRLMSLNGLRADFSHFKFDGWSIQCELILTAVAAAIQATESIMNTHSTIVPFLDDAQRRIFEKRFSAVREGFQHLIS
jgi:hypothetical protein